MSDCCATKNVMLLACSGGSNVGQIANDAAKALDRLGRGKMFCAVGVAGQLEIDSPLKTFVGMARKADTIVAVDGCEVKCVAKALAKAGLTADVESVATDLGIEKGHHFDYTDDQVAAFAAATDDAIQSFEKSGGRP